MHKDHKEIHANKLKQDRFLAHCENYMDFSQSSRWHFNNKWFLEYQREYKQNIGME